MLHWFELGLPDHDITQRVEVPYHRVHRFFLKLQRAIQEFEDESIRCWTRGPEACGSSPGAWTRGGAESQPRSP